MSIGTKFELIADAVYEKGKQTALDLVWEGQQQGGSRKDYSNAFKSGFFTDKTFCPKYDMRPTKASYMFAYQGYDNHEAGKYISDLSARLDEAGVVLDTSQCTDLNYMFYVANYMTHIPTISFESAVGTIQAFCTNANRIGTIDCLIFKEDGSNVFTIDSWGAPFNGCIALKNISIQGKIGCTISFAQSPLTKASIVSDEGTGILNCLSDTASGKTLTLKKTAVQKAFETSEGANDGNTSEEWLTLVASKLNWTITLA